MTNKKYLEGWRILHFSCFARNGRWGTCAACPMNHGMVYPEFCPETKRFDHNFPLDSLAELYKLRKKETELADAN